MMPKCESCPFNTQPQVYGEGYKTEGLKVIAIKDERQYDLVIVGMAPAREEIQQGRPFVGLSGQTLRKQLYQLGIQDYYTTNTLLCEITDDTLVPQAVDSCRERLLEEIKSKKPKLVIALGDLPFKALTDIDYTIKEAEGRIVPSIVGPLLPLAHPAYYLRHPQDFFDFIEAARSGLKFLKGEYRQTGEPELEVVNSSNLGRVLNELDRYEELAIDTETTGFFAYGWDPNTLLEMGIAGSPNKAYIVPKEIIPEFKALIEGKKTIFWNAQFDCAFLKQIGINPKPYFDGMLAHYSIDERPYNHGLKRVARIYLGSDDWERGIEQYLTGHSKKTVSYEIIPSDARYVYLSKDVTRTLQLKEVLEPDINRRVFWDILMPACRMFIEIENRGMSVDPFKMMDMEALLQKDLDKLGKEINELSGGSLNPNSPKQVSDYIYNSLRLPPDPKVGPTTNKRFLTELRTGYPAIDKILDYRELSKLKGTYIEGFGKFVDRRFRIHPSIKIFGSVTGRLSSSNPSIMNIKSLGSLKEMFLPDKDHVLLYSDVKQNELRWYYIISRDEALGDLFRSGRDPHDEVSIVAYGADRAKAMRTAAKAVVFGRLYKRSRTDIERQVGRENIDLLMQTVDGLFPELPRYYRNTMKELRSKGYLESYFGRRRKFPLITPDTEHEVERQAINFPIQSAGSDLMLMNMLHLWDLREELGIWPFWPYHDSITMDAESAEMLPKVKEEMEKYSLELVEGKIPFIWEMDWGYNWNMSKER